MMLRVVAVLVIGAECFVQDSAAAQTMEPLRPMRPPVNDDPLPPVSSLTDEAWREIDALDDPSWNRRELATERLKELEYNDEAIIELLEGQSRTPEQAHRLLQVLRHRLLNRPRGAVGISMDTNTGNDVVVLEVIAGMPAEQHLRAGDHILAVDHIPVRNPDHFGDLVKAKPPGDTVEITFRRALTDEDGLPLRDVRTGRMIYVDEPQTRSVPLGDLNQLGRTWVDRHREMQQRLALDAILRYSPMLRFVPSPDGINAEPPVLSGRVDDFPAIRALKNQIALINRGELVITADLQREWRQVLEGLTEMMSDRSLTADERFFIVQVIQRYAELLPMR